MVKSLEGNRLNMKVQELSKKNEHALICYVVAGYADMTTTEEIVSSLVSAPADIICFAKGHRPDKCLKISKNIRKISRSTNSYYDLFKYFTKSRLWKFYDTIKSLEMRDLFFLIWRLKSRSTMIEEASKLGLTIFLVSPNTSQCGIFRVCIYGLSLWNNRNSRIV